MQCSDYGIAFRARSGPSRQITLPRLPSIESSILPRSEKLRPIRIQNPLRRNVGEDFVFGIINTMNGKVLEWIRMGIGLWIVVSPWILGYWRVTSALWSGIVAGVLIMLLSLWQIVGVDKDNGQS